LFIFAVENRFSNWVRRQWKQIRSCEKKVHKT
jgi:hypothetical protein